MPAPMVSTAAIVNPAFATSCMFFLLNFIALEGTNNSGLIHRKTWGEPLANDNYGTRRSSAYCWKAENNRNCGASSNRRARVARRCDNNRSARNKEWGRLGDRANPASH